MSYQSDQDTDSPLSRWRFEELSGSTVSDDEVADRTGTINGGITLDQPALFVGSDLGALFDGSSGYINFSNTAGLLNIGTIEAVIQFNSVPSGVSPSIFTLAYSSGEILPLVLGLDVGATGSGLLGVGYFTGTTWETVEWSTAPTVNTPYHVVGTYDGTNLSLYINGVQVATTVPANPRPGSGSIDSTGYIGRRWDSAQYIDGIIWDLAIYGSALNSTDIANHFSDLSNPFSDDFANANPTFLGIATNGVDTTAWTTEVGEPGGMDHTGWLSFTPSASDIYRLSTVGSNFSTYLAVYTGTALTNLVLVGQDDNFSGGSGTSLLDVSLISGTTYYVQVGSPSWRSRRFINFQYGTGQ